MNVFRELYRAEKLPVFQNRMFQTQEEAIHCIKGDIVLVQDMETGLIFNQAFNPKLMQYDVEYQNEQSYSVAFRKHLSEVSEIIKKHFYENKLIEVGCGKGFFLEHLKGLGFDIIGVDPTYEGSNPSIIKKYFNYELGLHADGIILRHVLEHIQNPFAFLEDLRDANGGGGKVYIEVPCFDWICQHRAWFDIYYEHVNYFRLNDFERFFGRVYEAGHIFGGQYLYIVADLASLQVQINDFGYFEFPEDFLGAVVFVAENLKALKYVQRLGDRVVIWGGASKGVICALFMQRSGESIDFVIDINPAKQGKYIGASGIQISSPDEVIGQLTAGTDIFIMNSNYLAEIRQYTNNKFNYLTVDHENF